MRRVGDEEQRSCTEDFETFYRAHYPRLRNFVARRVPANDVDDVLVETFWIAARRYEQIPTDPERRIGWLLATARNTISNLRRTHRRMRRLSDHIRLLTPTMTSDADTPTMKGWANTQMHRAFDSLSNDDRTILLLDAWDGCTPNELAECLGCKPGTAKTRLSRAKARFRSAAEQETPDA